MKVLVTGKSGQLARSIAEIFGGHSKLKLVFASRPEFDFENPESLAVPVRNLAPDLIINAAAYTAVDKAEDEVELAERINGDAPGELGKIAVELGAGVIHISTDYVFDGSKLSPYVEDDPVNPIGAYGRSKLLGEEKLVEACPDAIVLRTAWVYSPFGTNFLKTMLNVAATRDTLRVVDDQIGNPTSALDLASAIFTIVKKWKAGSDAGRGEIYNCAGSGETSWCGFARHIFCESRKRGGPFAEVEPIPSELWPTPAKRPANSRLDCTKFERDFGFRMPDWRDSSADIIAGLLRTE